MDCSPVRSFKQETQAFLSPRVESTSDNKDVEKKTNLWKFYRLEQKKQYLSILYGTFQNTFQLKHKVKAKLISNHRQKELQCI